MLSHVAAHSAAFRQAQFSVLAAIVLALAPSTAIAGSTDARDQIGATGWAQINAQIAEDRRQAYAHDGGYALHNNRNRLTAVAKPRGISLTHGQQGAAWMRTTQVNGRALAAVAPTPAGNKVEFQRNTVSEWLINKPEGLEHGWTVHAPTGDSDQVRLHVELDGASIRAAAYNGLRLVLGETGQVLNYGAPIAW
ncbi:hypothetical protein GYB61_11450, partial [bacterium]|nr:hypothetical protein [bacterium]